MSTRPLEQNHFTFTRSFVSHHRHHLQPANQERVEEQKIRENKLSHCYGRRHMDWASAALDIGQHKSIKYDYVCDARIITSFKGCSLSTKHGVFNARRPRRHRTRQQHRRCWTIHMHSSFLAHRSTCIRTRQTEPKRTWYRAHIHTDAFTHSSRNVTFQRRRKKNPYWAGYILLSCERVSACAIINLFGLVPHTI